MPLLGDPGHREMIAFLKGVTGRWSRPAAILVVSAHWAETDPTVLAGANPAMFYDYYGFPSESYDVVYPAPGTPALGAKIADMIGAAGFRSASDEQRGFDHGLFVPLKLMYPDATIPCLQLSLIRGW